MQLYVPAHAYVSPRLCSKILQGQHINLVLLLLPSPADNHQVASSADFTAVFLAADPCLSRDLSIGEFLAAFGFFRDVLCSVYPECRVEMGTYLALIADLNLKYGRSLFFQYHKAFSSKAVSILSQSGVCLDWSVLDTELLVMLTHAPPCHSCSAVGHRSSFCPSVPFSRPPPPSRRLTIPLAVRLQIATAGEWRYLTTCPYAITLTGAFVPPLIAPFFTCSASAGTRTRGLSALAGQLPSRPSTGPDADLPLFVHPRLSFLATSMLQTHPDISFIDFLLIKKNKK